MSKATIKKYKIAVGICGPTVMYSNVIKAHSAEEAVEKFIAESEGSYSEADKDTLLNHTFEYETRSSVMKNTERNSMKDYCATDVKVGDLVAFICAKTDERNHKTYTIQKGTIQSFNNSSAVIECSDLESSFRLIETSGGYTGNYDIREYRLKKCALMNGYFPSENENSKTDALGQELSIGDNVAYMADFYQSSCPGFVNGTVTKLTAKFVEMDGSKRKTYEKVIRIHKAN